MVPMLVSAAAGTVVGIVARRLGALPVFASLAGWDAGAFIFLGIFLVVLLPLSAKATRARAAAEDPGRALVPLVVVLGSAASLLSAVVISASSSARHARMLVALSLANVALSWAVTHVAFSLRFAHLYYREDKPVGGVDFPGGHPPCYADFAYLAFTVGMTFQVSDTSISDGRIRNTVLLQALLSFVYNTAIIAFVLNLVFGLAS
jgi:uncharacterized membrane protein